MPPKGRHEMQQLFWFSAPAYARDHSELVCPVLPFGWIPVKLFKAHVLVFEMVEVVPLFLGAAMALQLELGR